MLSLNFLKHVQNRGIPLKKKTKKPVQLDPRVAARSVVFFRLAEFALLLRRRRSRRLLAAEDLILTDLRTAEKQHHCLWHSVNHRAFCMYQDKTSHSEEPQWSQMTHLWNKHESYAVSTWKIQPRFAEGTFFILKLIRFNKSPILTFYFSQIELRFMWGHSSTHNPSSNS